MEKWKTETKNTQLSRSSIGIFKPVRKHFFFDTKKGFSTFFNPVGTRSCSPPCVWFRVNEHTVVIHPSSEFWFATWNRVCINKLPHYQECLRGEKKWRATSAKTEIKPEGWKSPPPQIFEDRGSIFCSFWGWFSSRIYIFWVETCPTPPLSLEMREQKICSSCVCVFLFVFLNTSTQTWKCSEFQNFPIVRITVHGFWSLGVNLERSSVFSFVGECVNRTPAPSSKFFTPKTTHFVAL